MATKTQSVSCRLPTSLARRLDEEADLRGLNRSEYLRAIVTDALTQGAAEETNERLEELHAAVEKLGKNLVHKLAVATVALLSDMNKDPEHGPRLTQEEIKAFVQKALYA